MISVMEWPLAYHHTICHYVEGVTDTLLVPGYWLKAILSQFKILFITHQCPFTDNKKKLQSQFTIDAVKNLVEFTSTFPLHNAGEGISFSTANILFRYLLLPYSSLSIFFFYSHHL